MPASDFEAIAARQPELRKDAGAFHEILRYYKIKPGYNLLVAVFHNLGVNLIASTYLPSVICYFVIGCIMLMWLGRMLATPFSQLITLILMASPFLVTTARFSSPDMLCAALFFAGIFLIMESSVVTGLIILLTAITARPDAVVLYFLLCIAFYKTRKLNINQTAIFMFAGVATVLLIIKSPELFKEYLFTTLDYSSSWNANEMIINYGISLRDGFTSIPSSQVMLFTFLALATLLLRKRSGVALLSDQWSLLVIVSIASVFVRYLLHPVIEDRFLIANYLVVLMGFCTTMSETFSTKTQSLKATKNS